MAAGENQPSNGKLARLLLEMRAWGHMSAPLIQRLAAAAVSDGATCLDLTRLANIGSQGLYPANCERDLITHLAPNPITSALSTIAVPMISNLM